MKKESELASAAERIVTWYRANARDLPWRREVTAYRTLVSEIMLQQTRVEAVKPYFAAFLETFPDIASLALSDDDLLMKRWEGLGYYSRARNLKKCAIAVMEKHDGALPRDKDALLALPGIGPYTAGAISSFAYGIPLPAVDGNVLRVITRLTGDTGDITEQTTKARISDLVAKMIPQDAASDFGQGVIELGALVCVPNRPPLCDRCPLSELCEARRTGMTDKIPCRPKKAKRRIENKTILLVSTDDRTLIRQRPARGLLAGLWEFPSLEEHADADSVADVLRALGFEPYRITPTPPAKHIFTHIEWHMTGYLARVREPDELLCGKEYRMPTTEELLTKYPLPSAFSAFRDILLHGV